MQPEERDAAYLWDVHRHALRLRALTTGASREQFQAELMRRLAAERVIEIIGEAARRVSPSFREAHPEIEWRRIIGLRNVLVHQYAEVDIDILWGVATEHVPELIELLEPLIPLPPESEA